MTLFVSDIHFGRADAAETAADERAILDLFGAFGDRMGRLFLVGDVFDQYIEYRHLVPKGHVRFHGALASLTDNGVDVAYLAGNHDPWHVDYFERELGVRVIFNETIERLGVHTVYLCHGDGIAPATWKYNLLKPVLRHPIPVALYRNVIPGDLGFALARWVSHRFGGNELKPKMVEQMRSWARDRLRTTEADVVIMGHSHHPEHQHWPEGQYLNLGSWHRHRTFGALRDGEFRLLEWPGNGAGAVEWPVDVAA